MQVSHEQVGRDGVDLGVHLDAVLRLLDLAEEHSSVVVEEVDVAALAKPRRRSGDRIVIVEVGSDDLDTDGRALVLDPFHDHRDRSTLRLTIMMSSPRRAWSTASSAPMPLLAPVMTTSCPLLMTQASDASSAVAETDRWSSLPMTSDGSLSMPTALRRSTVAVALNDEVRFRMSHSGSFFAHLPWSPRVDLPGARRPRCIGRLLLESSIGLDAGGDVGVAVDCGQSWGRPEPAR